MAPKEFILFEFDYMLEYMFLGCYLLLMLNIKILEYLTFDLINIDPNLSRGTIKEKLIILFKSKIDELINSENDNKPVIINNNNNKLNINNTDIQSAENCKGFSETIRQLFNGDIKRYESLKNDTKF